MRKKLKNIEVEAKDNRVYIFDKHNTLIRSIKKPEVVFKPNKPWSVGDPLVEGATIWDYLPNGNPVYVDTPHGTIGIKWGNRGIWEPAPEGMTEETAEKHGMEMFFRHLDYRFDPANIEI